MSDSNSQNTNSQVNLTNNLANSNSTLTSEETKNLETLIFLDSLTAAITGFHLGELGDKMEEISQKCLQIFLDYVDSFLTQKYGQKEAMRVRAANKFNDATVFDKFAGLGEKFTESWDSFVEFLAKENGQILGENQINSQNLSMQNAN